MGHILERRDNLFENLRGRVTHQQLIGKDLEDFTKAEQDQISLLRKTIILIRLTWERMAREGNDVEPDTEERLLDILTRRGALVVTLEKIEKSALAYTKDPPRTLVGCGVAITDEESFYDAHDISPSLRERIGTRKIIRGIRAFVNQEGHDAAPYGGALSLITERLHAWGEGAVTLTKIVVEPKHLAYTWSRNAFVPRGYSPTGETVYEQAKQRDGSEVRLGLEWYAHPPLDKQGEEIVDEHREKVSSTVVGLKKLALVSTGYITQGKFWLVQSPHPALVDTLAAENPDTIFIAIDPTGKKVGSRYGNVRYYSKEDFLAEAVVYKINGTVSILDKESAASNIDRLKTAFADGAIAIDLIPAENLEEYLKSLTANGFRVIRVDKNRKSEFIVVSEKVDPGIGVELKIDEDAVLIAGEKTILNGRVFKHKETGKKVEMVRREPPEAIDLLILQGDQVVLRTGYPRPLIRTFSPDFSGYTRESVSALFHPDQELIPQLLTILKERVGIDGKDIEVISEPFPFLSSAHGIGEGIVSVAVRIKAGVTVGNPSPAISGFPYSGALSKASVRSMLQSCVTAAVDDRRLGLELYVDSLRTGRMLGSWPDRRIKLEDQGTSKIPTIPVIKLFRHPKMRDFVEIDEALSFLEIHRVRVRELDSKGSATTTDPVIRDYATAAASRDFSQSSAVILPLIRTSDKGILVGHKIIDTPIAQEFTESSRLTTIPQFLFPPSCIDHETSCVYIKNKLEEAGIKVKSIQALGRGNFVSPGITNQRDYYFAVEIENSREAEKHFSWIPGQEVFESFRNSIPTLDAAYLTAIFRLAHAEGWFNKKN